MSRKVMELTFVFLLINLLVGASFGRRVYTYLSDLPYDENGKLSTHLLVYPKACANTVEADVKSAPYGRELHPVSGAALSAIFGETDEEYETRFGTGTFPQLSECRAACLERGVGRGVVHATLPVYRFEGNSQKLAISRWLHNMCQKVEFGFINYHRPENGEKPINVYWIDVNGNRIPRGELKWGEKNTKFFQTFLGHKWLFEDKETKEVLLEHTVEFTGVRSIGQFPSSIDPKLDLRNNIHSIHRTEWERHKKVTRTFTELGFGKGRLPDDLFASMAAFYYNNNNYRVLEEWRVAKGAHINRWERDVFFIQGPWNLKVVWQTYIKDLVEQWAGVELENTSLYGLRRYEEGSRLLSHVDRVNTHAASVIINVAQGNVTKPWTVEVYDHADRLHEVVMEPGDIIYYESAKCLHGRNTPLQGMGAYYVNMFSHYRPVGDSEWYVRPNPEGTPQPLIDVGECWLEGTTDQYSQGAVKCDNPSIGPHLSPKNFRHYPIRATSGEDLSEWWEKVGEVTADGATKESNTLDEL
eukprot:CAMPEP_0113553968 /NCGR_PEP_ID=MMETSP0015_2-20120614/15893_1 /TAXON_ID=2838 /ORGANISM="Odontella" /LENGTH=526 /DNA_ID=CAMNT_0000455067 /DNA_START=294 /DNA_END=1874 /DNA_ORIENTATION=+ /assembly_acc=CAM_ASM_000160